MKVVSFSHNGTNSFGIVEGDQVADIGAVAGNNHGLKTFLKTEGVAALDDYSDKADRISLKDITFLPTIPNPDKVICIGLNYRTHIRESGRDEPKYPPLFFRVANAQTGHQQPLIRPKVSTEFDFEGELTVVIGRTGRHIRADDALSYVAGYTIFNEGSIRDWQRHTSQFGSGKNFYHSGAVGPWMVTTNEIPDPTALQLETRLNGEVMQTAGLDDLVFGVKELIVYLSKMTQLEPGDLIATGTPGGVGTFRDPKVFMKPGDRLEVEIDGIGVLSNPVADEI